MGLMWGLFSVIIASAAQLSHWVMRRVIYRR